MNYGAFLGSQTSSFQLRERSPVNTCRFIRSFVPGEIVRGHLYYEPLYAAELARRRAVNFFIYRDPRNVVVSEAHYLREMNRWHRLSPYFRKLPSTEAAITLSITGLNPPVDGLEYPNIAARFARYEGWLTLDNCLAIRFEDLASENRDAVIRQMAEFYALHCPENCDADTWVEHMRASIAPQKSHTFRTGQKSGWQKEFTGEQRRLFADLTGDLLIRLGYETNETWVDPGMSAVGARAPA